MKLIKFRLVLIGVVLSVLLWVTEAFLHTFIFKLEKSFIVTFLIPPLHELWMRLIMIFIILMFSILAQNITNKLHDMHKSLQEVERNLRNSYNRSKFYKDLFTHDVNNIYQIIFTSAEFILDEFNSPEITDTITTNLEMIKQQIKRGSKLINNVQKLFELEEFEIN